MGITICEKVMVNSPVVSVLVVCGVLASVWVCGGAAAVCPPGEQFWSPAVEACVNCTRCDARGHVVLRPCEVHRDTRCGPLSDLQIDWSWLAGQHRHQHRHRHHRRRKQDQADGEGVTEGPEGVRTFEADEALLAASSTEAPFSNVETLVWDWQAIALSLAVFACLLFFLVAGLYSIHQARQWKRLKDNFEADVEELSARLNLMVSSGELGETLEPNTGTITDGNYLSNHCVYLEQLLVRKDSKIGPGNVYIEESNTNASSKT